MTSFERFPQHVTSPQITLHDEQMIYKNYLYCTPIHAKPKEKEEKVLRLSEMLVAIEFP